MAGPTPIPRSSRHRDSTRLPDDEPPQRHPPDPARPRASSSLLERCPPASALLQQQPESRTRVFSLMLLTLFVFIRVNSWPISPFQFFHFPQIICLSSTTYNFPHAISPVA